MATVTGLTARRMLEIEARTVVGGEINASGNLILQRFDGTPIDAGPYRDASTVVKGVVQLATKAETEALASANRAVTPASLADIINGIRNVPGDKVQSLATNSLLETALPSAYPSGISLMGLTSGSGWSLNSGFGSVVTNNLNIDRCQQTFYVNAGGTLPITSWMRYHHRTDGGGNWTTWQQVGIINNLTPGSFTQSTALASYPLGQSRIYYTASNSNNWDFTGKAGEVVTYRSGTDYARQTWYRHVGGSTATTEMWVRTATQSGSWSKWLIATSDTGWINLPYASGYVLGTGGQLMYRVKDNVVYFKGGATGSFENFIYNDVVAVGVVPTAIRPTINFRGGAVGTGMRPGGFEINTDGSIKLGSGGLSTPPTWMTFTASYPLN